MAGRATENAVPSVTPSLRPYQEAGRDFLASNTVALLADEMRLGKTAQALRAAARLGLHQILVICPAIARLNWAREAAEWYPHVLWGGVVEKYSENPPLQGIVFASYEYARECTKKLKAAGVWELVIFDESQYLTRLQAQRTSSLMDFVLTHASRVWELTGTPMRSHPGELWRWAVFAGLTTMTYHEWVTRFCDSKWTGREVQIFGAKKAAIPELRQLLKGSGKYLRRKQSEVGLEMPKVTYSEYTVASRLPTLTEEKEAFSSLTHEQLQSRVRLQRNQLEAELAKHALGEAHTLVDADLAFLESLAQSVSTLRRYVAMVKVGAVVELLLEELANSPPSRKFFVLGIHKIFIETVRDSLMKKKLRCVAIYGGTPPATRDRHLQDFQTDPKFRVLVGNVSACGTAVSMSAATDVLVGEAPWVVADLRQAVARALGPMQKNKVLVRFVTLQDSVDSAVLRVLMRRAVDVDSVIDGADVKPRSNDIDIRSLLGE